MPQFTRREFARLVAGTAAATVVLPHAPAWAADDPDTLTTLTVTEISARIHSKTLTSTELVKALLDRVNVINPKVNAFVTVMGKEALAQAAVLDAEAKAGKFRGPLHGLPIVLKDNIDTAGTRTTAASEVFDDRIPDEDAFVCARLKAAGAVILGKANMHEFAMGHTSDVTYFGPVRNPWAPDHTPPGTYLISINATGVTPSSSTSTSKTLSLQLVVTP